MSETTMPVATKKSRVVAMATAKDPAGERRAFHRTKPGRLICGVARRGGEVIAGFRRRPLEATAGCDSSSAARLTRSR